MMRRNGLPYCLLAPVVVSLARTTASVARRIVLCIPITQQVVEVCRVNLADVLDLDVVLDRVMNAKEYP
jgi:hypothetical protein